VKDCFFVFVIHLLIASTLFCFFAFVGERYSVEEQRVQDSAMLVHYLKTIFTSLEAMMDSLVLTIL
jgi:hypothetical protein